MKDLFGKWWFWIFIFPSILGTIGWFISKIIAAAKPAPEYGVDMRQWLKRWSSNNGNSIVFDMAIINMTDAEISTLYNYLNNYPNVKWSPEMEAISKKYSIIT